MGSASMGHNLKQRAQRKIYHRVQDATAIGNFLAAVFNSYRLAELLPLTPLLLCLAVLSMFPDWVLMRADSGAEWLLSILLGGKRAQLRDSIGRPTGKSHLYSIVGALDPEYKLPDDRLLCIPKTAAERERAFPSEHAASWANAAFLSLCMKLAYEDWPVVRDVVSHEWRMHDEGASSGASSGGGAKPRTYLRPRFVKGCSFHHMQPAGLDSNEELAHIHLDSDACLIALEDPTRPPSSTESAHDGASGAGVALVLAFRGTEPLELADFQSDFDAVPEAGEWGCLHPGFLLALGLDINLNPYHHTLTTYTRLLGDEPAAVVMASQPLTPYEVLRGQINEYMAANPAARLYVTGHSLGGALAVVFMGALMHDTGKEAAAAKSRVGALYTYGQPRVGDFEFLCHLQVSLLEPNTDARKAGKLANGAPAAKSKFLRAQEPEAAGPPLTSRYIRVVNTYDIVPHIPPTLCNLYQHGGDLVYLQMQPGSIKFLTEQPLFFISGIFSSSVYKLCHYGAVLLGMKPEWKGRDNWLRFGMRFGACALPFLVAGLNDHMPCDYYQHIVNSDPPAWQPFRARKKLSRWTHAVMFARALSAGGGKDDVNEEADPAAAATPATGASSSAARAPQPKGRSAQLQAQLMQHSEQQRRRVSADA